MTSLEAPRPSAPPSLAWRAARTLLVLGLTLFCCFFLANGVMFPIQVPFRLAFGWIAFLGRVVPQVKVEPLAIGTGVLALVLFAGGTHAFASWLYAAMAPPEESRRWRSRWTVALVSIVVIAFASGISAVGLTHQTVWLATSPEPILQGSWRRHAAVAIGALKTIHTAQQIFREGDKDGDQVLDFGTLEELGKVNLIDSILASGEKQRYHFEAAPSVTSSELLWFATAAPTGAGEGDERFFFTNQSGAIFYTTKGPFRVDRSTCEVPAGLLPFGK